MEFSVSHNIHQPHNTFLATKLPSIVHLDNLLANIMKEHGMSLPGEMYVPNFGPPANLVAFQVLFFFVIVFFFHSLTHLLTYSLTHSFIHSFIHIFTHSLSLPPSPSLSLSSLSLSLSLPPISLQGVQSYSCYNGRHLYIKPQ